MENSAKSTKKILVVDDSALMRRVLCDIIESDERFEVADRAINGLDAFDLLSRKTYDAVVLDVNMPKMNGLELLQELRKYKISARVMMASTDTADGAKVTLDALELGALDFVHKPEFATECRSQEFRTRLLDVLAAVAESNLKPLAMSSAVRRPVSKPFPSSTFASATPVSAPSASAPSVVSGAGVTVSGSKIVALASSTGGPKALQDVLPRLPKNLDAPVLVVQHMPKGFTASLAERLNGLSEIRVKEAEEGDVLENGVAYISMGGRHMNVKTSGTGRYTIHYTDEPNREGVKPCANYMYESLQESRYDRIVCVVLTGMGADGTEGIQTLKSKKKIHVIAQNRETCVVYGMPKCVAQANLADSVVALEDVAREIVAQVGTR